MKWKGTYMTWERKILRQIRGPTHDKCYSRIKVSQEIYNKLISPDNVTVLNTLRTGLLNCLNARSQGLTFRHRASCIQGQAFRYSPENAFYIFNQQIYLII